MNRLTATNRIENFCHYANIKISNGDKIDIANILIFLGDYLFGYSREEIKPIHSSYIIYNELMKRGYSIDPSRMFETDDDGYICE